MRYLDVVDLDQHFDPVFKLADGDKSAAWSTFIPTVEPFEDLLRQTLDAFESHEPKAQRPLWVQGTYGTGKSHAASVISHLLDDDVDGLEPFLARMKVELAAHVRSFRQGRRILPIYLYGSGTPLIRSARTFDLAVQTAVKEGLTRLGLRVDVPDDFDRYVDQVERNPLRIDWDGVIHQDGRLRAYAPTGKGELLHRLKSQDRDVLGALEDYFAESGNAFLGTTSLTKWLGQVLDTSLAEGAPYSGAMIYWDEFTSVLELTRARDIAAALQRLAEFCQTDPRLKLLIISHRKPGQLALDVDEQKKIDDRFKMVDYRMTDVTVYKILSSAILRKDRAAYGALVSDAYASHGELDALVGRLEAGGAEGMREDIRGLFPIHPYTAYLATLISHHIGSSDRSIFMFLHDGERGFKKFIAENPEAGRVWLTPDTLWDYFAPTLSTDEPEQFLAVNAVYNQRRAVVSARGSKCATVFKSMLLLNFLRTYLGSSDILESSLLEPTLDNCEAMLAGTDLQGHAGEELEFLEEQGALHKMGSDYLVMHGATLPEEEVRREAELLGASYGEDVVSLLDRAEMYNLESKFCGSSVLRDSQLRFFTGGPHAALFHRKSVDQLGFGSPAALHVAVILYARDDNMLGANEQLSEYASRAVASDPALVILEALTPVGSKKLQDLVSHLAHAAVADRHALPEVKADYGKMANDIVDNWVQQLGNSSSYNVYVGNTVTSIGCTVLPTALQHCCEQVFANGFDDVQGVPKTCWRGGGKNIAERVLQAESLDDLVGKLAGVQKQTLSVFKKGSGGAYVLNQRLELNADATEEPIGRLSHYVQKALEPMSKKVQSFNLGDCLQGLAVAPYGLYENLLHSATLAFALRPYVNRLYDSNGRRIGVLPMREIVTNLFKYWSESRGHDLLDVQFGTETEERLVQILKNLFELSDVGTLMDARGQLRTWVDQKRRPLWSLKYASEASALSAAVDALCALLQMTQGDMSETEMEQRVAAIDPVSAEVTTVLTKEYLDGGFCQWLATFTKSTPSAERAEELYGELSRQMAGSPSVWAESLAREKILGLILPPARVQPVREAAARVSEILGIPPSDDLAMVQLAGREAVRGRKYPLFAAALAAPTPTLRSGIEALHEFLQADSVDHVDVDVFTKAIDEAGVDRVRHAVTAEALESSFGKWAADRLGTTPSSDMVTAAYQSLLVGTGDTTLCRESQACDAFQKHPPAVQQPEDYKEKIRKRVIRQPAAQAQKLLVELADSAANGWAILGQLLGEEEDGKATS
jgi:hypothetical protein